MRVSYSGSVHIDAKSIKYTPKNHISSRCIFWFAIPDLAIALSNPWSALNVQSYTTFSDFHSRQPCKKTQANQEFPPWHFISAARMLQTAPCSDFKLISCSWHAKLSGLFFKSEIVTKKKRRKKERCRSRDTRRERRRDISPASR